MIKKIELEIDCTEAIENGAKYCSVDRDGTIRFFERKPYQGTYCFFADSSKKVQPVITNWKSLCFKIVQEKPVWLTERLVSRLQANCFKFIVCTKSGKWNAYKKEPSIIKDGKKYIWDGEGCYLVHNDIEPNHDWKDSIIKIGE